MKINEIFNCKVNLHSAVIIGQENILAQRDRLWVTPAADPGCSRGKGMFYCKLDKFKVPKVN